MDVRQLEMFRAVVEEGGFTRASEKLHVSQSAISRQLKLLEEELGTLLLHRTGRGVILTPQGEIRLTVELDPSEDGIVFAVADTGIGIAPEDLDRIFEEYAQVESPLQRRSTGTGLGLPLSRKLAVLLGGSLTARSRPGQGSTFTLRLPRVHPTQAEADGPGAETGMGAGGGHG